MNILIIFILSLLTINCGASLPAFENKASAPSVALTLPEEGEVLSDAWQALSVVFDAPMDPETLTQASFLVSEGRWTWEDFGATDAIEKAIDKGTLVVLAGDISQGENEEEWTWTPAHAYEPYHVYTLILTSRILSEAHLPLTADARAGNRAFFFHYYSKGFDPEDTGFPGNDGLSDSDQEGTDAAGGEEKDNGGAMDSGASSASDAALSWTELFLNEIYYDCDGDETDGCQFIELAGTPGASIAGVELLVVNGSDGKVQKTIVFPEEAVLSASGYYVVADARTRAATETQVAHADLILNFDPQNGPDAIELLDEHGALVDSVGYGDGMIALGANGFPLYESTPAIDVKAGHSLCRREGKDGNSNRDNFAECMVTPGADNQLVVIEAESEESADPEGTSDEDLEGVAIETDISESPETLDVEETVDEAGPSEEWSEIQSLPQVIITEVVTDPQRDWNDSAGGDGIPYNAVLGTGTVGSTDEWVELYNASGEVLDLRGWSLVMSDATPETHVFAEGDKTAYFAAGSSVDAWLPEEYLILGNPEGDLKNDNLNLTLLDPEGESIDAWFVENADAKSVDDESWQRFFEDGVEVIEEGIATPWE